MIFQVDDKPTLHDLLEQDWTAALFSMYLKASGRDILLRPHHTAPALCNQIASGCLWVPGCYIFVTFMKIPHHNHGGSLEFTNNRARPVDHGRFCQDPAKIVHVLTDTSVIIQREGS